MFWTSIARSVPPTNISHSLQKLLPKTLPPSLQNNPGNLYQVLSRTPSGGVGKRVYQLRWSEKGIEDCYWIVTQSRFKCEGKHGKAWGHLYWKGASWSNATAMSSLAESDKRCRQECEPKRGTYTGRFEVFVGRG